MWKLLIARMHAFLKKDIQEITNEKFILEIFLN